MQVQINSTNIDTLQVSLVVDILNRKFTFNASGSTYNNMSGTGELYVRGIAFSLVDSDNVELLTIDWNAPQIPSPATSAVYEFDASSLGYNFLFQTYKIICAIKDQDGTVYYTPTVYKKICEPNNFSDGGYVPGMFQMTPDCVNNSLTVKEISLLVYNNEKPTLITKSGILYYPTGTINQVAFTGTPFTNNVIYTGQYRITNNTVGRYDLQDLVYVDVTYFTNNVFDITCANRMSSLLCCIKEVQDTALKNCNNSKGIAANEKLREITPYLLSGLLAEIGGQDSSTQADYIRKFLNCNCGNTSIKQTDFSQNELTPTDPSVYSIVIQGVGGTTVPSPTINGHTKTYNIASNNFQVVKGDTGDLGFDITVDTSVQYVTKYKITINYDKFAGNILDAITINPVLLSQFNDLVDSSALNIDLSDLNGKCILDISSANYFISYLLSNGNPNTIVNIVIGSTTYNAPANLFPRNAPAVTTWLNSLGLGTFMVGYNQQGHSAYSNISSVNNSNPLVSVTYGSTAVPFQKTSHSLIAVLQAIIDYLCGMTALQVALGNNLTLCSFDYNGSVINTSYVTTDSQGFFNTGVANTICNIVARINTLTGVTCDKIKAIFNDYPNASFNLGTDYFMSVVGGNCTKLSGKQAAMSFISAINAYSDVKSAFCAIDCAVPSTCPDVSATNFGMSGSNIGLYGLSWNTLPNAVQTVTVRYRVTGTQTWTVATNSLSILVNGNINGTTPFLITGVLTGTTYDIQVVNNCGGTGFINQITTPTGSVYSGTYLLGNVLYSVCGATPVTLYSLQQFAAASGVILYTDIACTHPVTGYVYVASTAVGGLILNLGTTTGIVGSSTGSQCGAGQGRSIIAGNVLYSLCGTPPSVFYTNGNFTVGGILYYDSSLVSPVMGYTYIVYNGAIYNINPSTGVITSSTGLNCVTETTLTVDYRAGEWLFTLSDDVPFDITLTSAIARGGVSNSCAAFTQSDSLTPLVLSAGVVSGSQLNNDITCASTFYRIDNAITVNGTALTNGGTLLTGGVTINVVILHHVCIDYVCV